MKWTAADKKRARIEGWDISNGYPIRVFNIQGHSRFLSVYEIVAHIYQCAESSEWHRDIFLSLPWTTADDIQARNDGWDLSRANMNIRSFSALVFPTDQHARDYVAQQATKSNALCLKALRKITLHRLDGD